MMWNTTAPLLAGLSPPSVLDYVCDSEDAEPRGLPPQEPTCRAELGSKDEELSSFADRSPLVWVRDFRHWDQPQLEWEDAHHQGTT